MISSFTTKYIDVHPFFLDVPCPTYLEVKFLHFHSGWNLTLWPDPFIALRYKYAYTLHSFWYNDQGTWMAFWYYSQNTSSLQFRPYLSHHNICLFMKNHTIKCVHWPIEYEWDPVSTIINKCTIYTLISPQMMP